MTGQKNRVLNASIKSGELFPARGMAHHALKRAEVLR